MPCRSARTSVPTLALADQTDQIHSFMEGHIACVRSPGNINATQDVTNRIVLNGDLLYHIHVYIYIIYISNILRYNLDSLSSLSYDTFLWQRSAELAQQIGSPVCEINLKPMRLSFEPLKISNRTSHKISVREIRKPKGSCLTSLPRMSLPMAILTCTSDGREWEGPVTVLWCPAHMKLHTSHWFPWKSASNYRQTSSSKSFQVVICLRLVPGLDPGVLFLATSSGSRDRWRLAFQRGKMLESRKLLRVAACLLPSGAQEACSNSVQCSWSLPQH